MVVMSRIGASPCAREGCESVYSTTQTTTGFPRIAPGRPQYRQVGPVFQGRRHRQDHIGLGPPAQLGAGRYRGLPGVVAGKAPVDQEQQPFVQPLEVGHVRGGVRQVEHGPVDRYEAQPHHHEPTDPSVPVGDTTRSNSIVITLSPSRARA